MIIPFTYIELLVMIGYTGILLFEMMQNDPRMVGFWDFLDCWVYIGNYALISINQNNHPLSSIILHESSRL